VKDFWVQLEEDMRSIPGTSVLPDDRVWYHICAAVLLARIEQKPPGWDENDWMIYLVDLPYDTLRNRLYEQIFKQEGRGPIAHPGDLLDAEVGIDLPELPEMVPPVLTVKMRALQHKWMGEYLYDALSEGMKPFLNKIRSATLLRQAQHRAREIMRDLEVAMGPLGYKVKLTMTDTGQIMIDLTDTGGR